MHTTDKYNLGINSDHYECPAQLKTSSNINIDKNTAAICSHTAYKFELINNQEIISDQHISPATYSQHVQQNNINSGHYGQLGKLSEKRKEATLMCLYTLIVTTMFAPRPGYCLHTSTQIHTKKYT